MIKTIARSSFADAFFIFNIDVKVPLCSMNLHFTPSTGCGDLEKIWGGCLGAAQTEAAGLSPLS